MRFDELLDEIDQIEVDEPAIQANIERMMKDLDTAKEILVKDPSWCVSIVHQAIYRGCAAVMAAHGYRARSREHHRVAIRFAQIALPREVQLLRQADRLRRDRNRHMYDGLDTITLEDAEAGVVLASKLCPVLARAARSIARG